MRNNIRANRDAARRYILPAAALILCLWLTASVVLAGPGAAETSEQAGAPARQGETGQEKTGPGEGGPEHFGLSGYAGGDSARGELASGATYAGSLSPDGPLVYADRAPLPLRVTRHAVATNGSFLFVIGGLTPITPTGPVTSTSAVQRYDPVADSYSALAPLPGLTFGLSSIDACAMNGKIYVQGGFDNTSANVIPTLFIYDIAGNSWSTGAPVPAPATVLYNAVCNAATNKMYVIGGVEIFAATQTGVATNANKIYDATLNSWSDGAPLPAGRQSARSGLIGGAIYVAGGFVTTSGLQASSTDTQRYDIAGNSWSTVAPINIDGTNGAGGVQNGQLYVAGGGFSSRGGFIARTERYDPASNTWTLVDNLLVSVRNTSGGSAGNNFYVIGGNTGLNSNPRCPTNSSSLAVCDHTQQLMVPVGTSPTPTATSTAVALPCVLGQPYTDIEPNDYFTQTQFLTVINTAQLNGVIDPVSDRDYFSFNATAGDRIWAYAYTLGARGSSNSQMTLLNTMSNTIQFDAAGGSQATNSSAIAGAYITQTGTSTLRVQHFDNTNTLKPYSLFLDRTTSSTVSEVEPNDSSATANPFAYGTVVTGTIPISTDLDLYSFTIASAGGKVVVQVDGDPERDGVQFNPNFDILASDGTTTLTAVDSDSTFRGGLLSESAVFTPTVAGTFYVRVKTDITTTGTYNMHLYQVNTNACVPPPPTATATRTSTAVPTLTSTAVPTLTSTAVPPSSTGTAIPPAPTNTPVPVASATSCSISFVDVAPTDYFYEPVRYLFCRGVISGYSDNTFRPYANTTRGQLAKIIVLAEGFPITTPAAPTFNDVPTSNVFYPFIETAAARQIVSGYSDGSFRPFNNVTRGQLSKIIVVAEGWALVNPATPTFADTPPENPFYTFIETAASHGIISGYADGTFRWGNNATRGQISKIVYLAVTGP